GYQEVALRLMTAIATDSKERMILNVANAADGARTVAELPDDLMLEVGCIVDGKGVHPQPVAPPTLGQLGRMARLRDSERCILKAAVDRDKGAAWEGFSSHPLVDSPKLGQQLLDGYIEHQPMVAALFA
ncbi:MAG: 6-phospho-beta-glucosidase, partial [Propionibacterium sp.]|nr:6-phospho-beta-glucosidase [Propionibacterium sp.]